MTSDDVADAEGEAVLAYEQAGLDPECPVAPSVLCERLFGTRPTRERSLPRESLMGRVGGSVRIYVRAGVSPARARWLVCHELAHAVLGRYHSDTDPLLERRCDLLGSCLLAPRPAFRGLVKRLGHSVYDLAHALSATQAHCLLRLGETTGRPVRLLGQRERVRGDEFVWPDVRKCLRGEVRRAVHPVRLADEKKWGLMVAG